MNKEGFKRKKLFINPAFQIRYILLFVSVSVIMTLSIILFSCWTYRSLMNTLSEHKARLSLYTDVVNELDESGVTVFWLPEEVKRKIIFKIIIFSLSLSLIIIIIAIFTSHKIAGPLYRLNDYFLRISKDESLPPLRFRDGDEFQNLADSFNKCIHHLKSRAAKDEVEKGAPEIKIKHL